MNRDAAYLADIFLACEAILLFTRGMTREQFVGDDRTTSAVAYKLVIIGEAIGRLSDEFKQSHPAVPWQTIRSVRNIVTHQYDAIDLDHVWRMAFKHVPELMEQVRPLLPDELE